MPGERLLAVYRLQGHLWPVPVATTAGISARHPAQLASLWAARHVAVLAAARAAAAAAVAAPRHAARAATQLAAVGAAVGAAAPSANLVRQ